MDCPSVLILISFYTAKDVKEKTRYVIASIRSEIMYIQIKYNEDVVLFLVEFSEKCFKSMNEITHVTSDINYTTHFVHLY